jgi:hypothetical protein
MIRKPLLFLFVLAAGASLIGGGRLSLRLLLDTATALAPLAVIQVVALAVVFWTGRRPVGFSSAVDAYFDGNGPWFAAIVVLAAFGAFASPVAAAQWFTRLAAAAVLAAILATIRLDFVFFRSLLGRTPGRAAADVILQRAIGWGGTLAYLLVMAAPKASSLIPNIATNLFGARP